MALFRIFLDHPSYIIQIFRSKVKSLNNIHLLIIRKRHHKVPLITRKNKSATRGAQVVSIRISTPCLLNLVLTHIEMVSNKMLSASHTCITLQNMYS